MTGADAGKGRDLAPAPGDEELRAALRHALARFIDPDDDTMPALNRADGGFTWVPAGSVIDDLMKVVEPLARMYLQAMGDLGRALDRLDGDAEKT
ncbi:hypothetical protein ACH4F6_39175 [Streptomyces sp. NPDC017936]|uniref:hypothetical protein n=1 Tax=Streptomyces sp. NPDC017936 TaxID=3365016 RepID=UPI0037B53E53